MNTRAPARQPTYIGRIVDLERRVDEHDAMKVQVSEMHEILIAIRTIGRAVRFVLTWFGGPSVVGTAGLYAWRFFTGH
jgi:hypothetical protein